MRAATEADDWVLMFTGVPEAAKELARRLDAAGIEVLTTLDPGPVIFSAEGARRDIATLAVPADREPEARDILEAWERRTRVRAHVLGRRLAAVLVVSLAPPTVWLVLHALGIFPIRRPTWPDLAIFWLISLVVVARIEHHRHGTERPDLDDA